MAEGRKMFDNLATIFGPGKNLLETSVFGEQLLIIMPYLS